MTIRTPKSHFPALCLALVLNFSALLTLAFLMTGCESKNLISGFRLAFAASAPFVQSLVTSGAVTQTKADAAKTDIGDAITAASQAETCIKAITSSGAQKRVEKAKCYFQLAQDLRLILERHNLAGEPRLDQIATIGAGAIEAFEAFYTTVNTGGTVTGPDGGITHTGADGISGSDADKELERSVKALNDQLKDLVGS